MCLLGSSLREVWKNIDYHRKSITSRLIKNKRRMWGSELHTFSIFIGAPDLKYAKKLADFLEYTSRISFY